jgi:hypothetical protein
MRGIVYEAKDVKTKITLFVFRALMIHGCVVLQGCSAYGPKDGIIQSFLKI